MSPLPQDNAGTPVHSAPRTRRCTCPDCSTRLPSCWRMDKTVVITIDLIVELIINFAHQAKQRVELAIEIIALDVLARHQYFNLLYLLDRLLVGCLKIAHVTTKTIDDESNH